MKIKIGLCQIKTSEQISENLKRAETNIQKAAEEGCRIAALPEMFCCPYSLKSFRDFSQPAKEGCEIYDFLSECASKFKISLIGGSMPEKDGSRIYNSCLIFESGGRLAAKHRKNHLFDVDIKNGIKFTESAVLSKGDKFTVAEIEGIKAGIGICYDIRFPELAERMALNGAEILFYPGAFNMTTGPAHWELTIRARALDCQCYTAGIAPALNTSLSYHSYGHSMAADPWGNKIAGLDFEEGFKSFTADTDMIREIREQLPLLKEKMRGIADFNKGF